MKRDKSFNKGFTLLELLVVIVIISMAMMVVWPRLPRMASAEKQETLNRIAFANQALYEYATFKKKV